MQIQFFGGARTVTGSQHLLTVNGHKILLECGLFQGRREDTYEKNLNFQHSPPELDAMILSHAHIDHSGNIPNLHKNGFNKHIYATMATVDLCQIMLRDSAYLNEKDVEWVNRVRASKGEPPLEPLYTIDDAEEALNLFVGIQYGRRCPVAPGVTVTFQDAGHILGSAGMLLELEEGSRKLRLGFSGDIGRPDMPILRDPQPLTDIDALIMESTYGDRHHPPNSDSAQELADVVNHIVRQKGKLIIPAFAVGRTQLIVYLLHRLLEQDKIPHIPMYVDSPMACNAMEVFRAHPEVFDRETYEHFLHDEEDPFTPEGIAYIRDVEGSKRLNELSDPHIIIAASGMAEGGRVVHHLKNNIGDKKTVVLFVGFAAPHTLARRLMDGSKKVRIFGEEYTVKADVRSMPYFSAHADQTGLLEYVSANSTDRLRQIFLVHGEPDQAEVLRDKILERGFETVHIPSQGEAFTLEEVDR